MNHLMIICLIISGIMVTTWVSNKLTWLAIIFCALSLYLQTLI